MSTAPERPQAKRSGARRGAFRPDARPESWYVYYSAPSDGSALARVRAMQQQLSLSDAVRARLEERVATSSPTWMEVYEGVVDPELFAVTLEAALATHRVAELLGTRTIERFRCL